MKIKVAHGERPAFEINIQGSATVSDLKDKLAQLTGVPPDKQDVQMMGDSLCDEASLAEQGVQNMDRLILVTAGSSTAAASATPPYLQPEPTRGTRRSPVPSGGQPRQPGVVSGKKARSPPGMPPSTSPPIKRPPPGAGASGPPSAAAEAGGGSASAPLGAVLKTLDGVSAELDAMHGKVRAREPVHQELFTRLLEKMDCLELDSLSDGALD